MIVRYHSGDGGDITISMTTSAAVAGDNAATSAVDGGGGGTMVNDLTAAAATLTNSCSNLNGQRDNVQITISKPDRVCTTSDGGYTINLCLSVSNGYVAHAVVGLTHTRYHYANVPHQSSKQRPTTRRQLPRTLVLSQVQQRTTQQQKCHGTHHTHECHNS
ncbi:unnamed protein product [Aphis gossypii]|uniref:Uncharacterized protein n=1 Tax=Aphis gossypii TaxID=80765 RepID=A0A9P0NQ00_APHGO|nr:unnamed protein product [Aphis gossypii]CAH1737319.1 unnamed protein product [Aphis gossypii]